DVPQEVRGLTHVAGGQFPYGGVDVRAPRRQLPQLFVVRLTARQRVGEDRRVGGDPHDVLVADQPCQVARPQSVARQVVEPDRYARFGQLSQPVGVAHDVIPLFVAASYGWGAPAAVVSTPHPSICAAVLCSGSAPRLRQRPTGGLHHGFGGEPELLEQRVVVRRGAELLDRDDLARLAREPVPRLGRPGLDDDAGLDGRGENRVAVLLV